MTLIQKSFYSVEVGIRCNEHGYYCGVGSSAVLDNGHWILGRKTSGLILSGQPHVPFRFFHAWLWK